MDIYIKVSFEEQTKLLKLNPLKILDMFREVSVSSWWPVLTLWEELKIQK